MSKILYLECNSGISGDMSVAALLDLGADRDILLKALNSLPVKGFTTSITRVTKSALDCMDFNVILDKEHDGHDHDMEYLHGHEHHHEHNHEEHHEEHHHEHHHEHRNLSDIITIIDGADITEKAAKLAKDIFTIIAKAEAKAHGTTIDEVHFHEVGAVDSIVDIISFAVCFDNLGITDVIIPYICEGSGTIRAQHGILPIPVPAVTNIAGDNNLTLRMTGVMGELVTPTGAAIAAAIRTSTKLPDEFRICACGLGAGKREYETPGFLRAMIIEPEAQSDCIYRLETNVDDCSGEMLGYTMERLLSSGARDVHYVPVYMKKNRPAYELVVICTEDKIPELEQIIFEETTTIGIRRVKMDRTILDRKIVEFNSSIGTVMVKECQYNGRTFFYPEYESIADCARKTGSSYRELMEIVKRECENGR